MSDRREKDGARKVRCGLSSRWGQLINQVGHESVLFHIYDFRSGISSDVN